MGNLCTEMIHRNAWCGCPPCEAVHDVGIGAVRRALVAASVYDKYCVVHIHRFDWTMSDGLCGCVAAVIYICCIQKRTAAMRGIAFCGDVCTHILRRDALALLLRALPPLYAAVLPRYHGRPTVLLWAEPRLADDTVLYAHAVWHGYDGMGECTM